MYPYKIFGMFYLYGLMISIGLILAFILLFFLGKKKNIHEDFMDFIFYDGIASIVVGFGSAALFQAVYNYIENPAAGFHLDGGITFIGGLIGGVICFLVIYFIFRPRLKGRLVDVLTMLPCAVLLGHGFGRIGCLFAGCCHGAKTDAWYGIMMRTAEYGWAKVVPTQLFEALFLFALCAVCLLLFFKKDFKHNMSVYLIGYGIWRFFIEYARADDRGAFVGGISPSQFWALLMIALGIGLIFLMNALVKKREEELKAEKEGAVLVQAAAETDESAPSETSERAQAMEEKRTEVKMPEEKQNTQETEKEL